ncbi:MAG: hypothetical protein PF904_14910 [Kiritimatiellae bacterium]|jgi:hypothetical protein|nr:hypothetical protein [Kiritimatiellia bacterium]
MKVFRIIFCVVAVVGTIAVYFIAPLARPLMKDSSKGEESFAQVMKGPRFDPDKDVSPVKMQVKKSPVGTAPKSVKLLVSNDDDDDPPALMGIFRASGREKPTWGVIRDRTNFYGEDGKRLGELPPGVIVIYNKMRVSSKGRMAFCTLQYKGKEIGPYLMQPKDLCFFTGDYTRLSDNQRSNMDAYYKARGAMEDRKEDVMHEMAIRNPHYTLYKAAYDEYMAHIDESRAFVIKRDKAEGLVRSRLDDKLRRMKNEETALQKKYNEIHTKYKRWKMENADSLPDATKDAKVKEYRAEMRRLAKLIPGLAY